MSTTQQAAVHVLAKMALANRVVTEEERELLSSMLEAGQTLDAVFMTAAGHTLAELIGPIESYPDRFFVALRAAGMAHIDSDFDADEESMLQSLVEQLGITPEDRILIQGSPEALSNPGGPSPAERIQALFAQSSFA